MYASGLIHECLRAYTHDNEAEEGGSHDIFDTQLWAGPCEWAWPWHGTLVGAVRACLIS